MYVTPRSHRVCFSAPREYVEQDKREEEMPPLSPLRVALFGTHPQQYNGYSKVVYELARQLALRPSDELQLSIFGFQRAPDGAVVRPDMPLNVSVFDASAAEEPKRQGFGLNAVREFVALAQPHVVVVYNDLSVLTAVLAQLKEAPERASFRVLAYVDQVYGCQKKEYVRALNEGADAAMAFTPSWARCLKGQGLTLPCYALPHGVNPEVYYPVRRDLVRRYYGVSDDDFLVLNMNRNQPRKRWDVCLMAWAEIVARLHADAEQETKDAPVKLVVAATVRGAWNLLDVYERELGKRGLSLQQGLRHVVFVDKPQGMSDREVNLLYNLCDVGLNTCDGEGFGLCNAEHAATGKPQVVAAVGAFPDLFDASCGVLVEPAASFYLDSSRDAVGGEARLCAPDGFVEGVLAYYRDPELRRQHGELARQRMRGGYNWPQLAKRFEKVCRLLLPPQPKPEPEPKVVDRLDCPDVAANKKAPKTYTMKDARDMMRDVDYDSEKEIKSESESRKPPVVEDVQPYITERPSDQGKEKEPKKAEPKKAEPKKAEPKKAEPKKAEPKKAKHEEDFSFERVYDKKTSPEEQMDDMRAEIERLWKAMREMTQQQAKQ